jgi:hypothetical protein
MDLRNQCSPLGNYSSGNLSFGSIFDEEPKFKGMSAV